MADMVRDFDWSVTPLGPLEEWSPVLRTSLAMCLHSRFPMVVYWGSELIYLYNDANRDAIGQLHPRALGRPAREMLPESWHVLEPRLLAVLERGEASWAVDEKLVFSFRERPEAGYFTYSFSPIHEADGRVGGVLLVTQDTTERVLAERRLALLRKLAAVGDLDTVDAACGALVAALEDSPDLPLACIHLLEGTTLRCVAASPGVTPLPAPPALGEAVPASQLMRGEAVPQRAAAVPFDGGVLVAALSDERIVDGEYRRLLDQVAAQIAQNVVAARLHEGIRRHAQEVEDLDAAKTTFFSNASHELRTPLTLVLGGLEQALEESGSEWLYVARRNAMRMLRIVNSLLDYSRLEAHIHTGVFQPVELGELTSRLVAMFESAATLAGLELVNGCRPLGEPVYVDREAWEKVIGNLLSNALKFTPEGRIVVTTELDGEHAVLTVADTGLGIAPENLEHVFSRFFRLSDPRARGHDGTGIGLALVREIAHLHGGTVEAHSQPGEGTQMVVRIPRGRAHLPADELDDATPSDRVGDAASLFVEDAVGWFEGPSPAPGEDRWLSAVTAGEAPARVLVVDDNADLRTYLVQLLAPYFEVVTALDGDRALAAAITEPPDVIVSDVMMPGLDGLELVRALRADTRTQDVPIVLLSARAGTDRLDALHLGADDYLLKPVSARELVARVRATVQLFRVRREVAETRGRLEERAGVERDLRAAHRRVVTAADAERRRIERNLHDGAQQRLIAILMQLEAIADDPAKVTGALGSICDELARALEELRDLAHGLFPPLLVSDGLEAALDAAARRAGLPVRLDARGVGRFGPEVEAAVYFCCVEALQNAAKHAGAGARVTVALSRTPHTLEFSVEDDGVGFVPTQATPGYGLANLRDRVEALGGTPEVVSVPGRGTAVRGAVPIS
jgi:signal transduction histidine kinase